jgi:hypothetical protein
MAAAMLSRTSSSPLLITRASSMTCWQSRTSMPSFWSAKRKGGSTMSMPSGIFATPSRVRMRLISRAACSKSPAEGGTAPRMPTMPARQWSGRSHGA